MALLLNIDTATEQASVCISHDDQLLAIEKSPDQKNHASFLHIAIKKLTSKINIALNDLDAIAVTAGPGSYTGLRVGLSSAKGLCYALQKPLILVNTLKVMALASIQEQGRMLLNTNEYLYSPMIDARRMEVFVAVYNNDLKCLLEPAPVILEENSFSELLTNNRIIFSGSGCHKFKKNTIHPNAFFAEIEHNAANMLPISIQSFENKEFANLAYSEPVYLKEFFIK